MSQFPPDFFTRADDGPDDDFYEFDRFVTHIDDRAIAAVGGLYEHLGLDGRVLDLMSSWVSHFRSPPRELVALGMNEHELAGNRAAHSYVVHDLNIDPKLPFDDARFDAVTCCVSVDYLVHPIDVFAETRRVLVPGGVMVCTFSNRCFATKAIPRLAGQRRRGSVPNRGGVLPPIRGMERAAGSRCARHRVRPAILSMPCGQRQQLPLDPNLSGRWRRWCWRS